MSIAVIPPVRAGAPRGGHAAVPRVPRQSGRDIGFAIGIVAILAIFFLPVPSFLIDLGIACSIALSVLILMVALWIDRPLDFSAFPDRPPRRDAAAPVAQYRDDPPDPVGGSGGVECRWLHHRRLLAACDER